MLLVDANPHNKQLQTARLIGFGFDITIDPKLTNWRTAIQQKKSESASLRTGNTLLACLAAIVRTIRANSVSAIRYDPKTVGFHPIARLRFVAACPHLPAIAPSLRHTQAPSRNAGSQAFFLNMVNKRLQQGGRFAVYICGAVNESCERISRDWTEA
ncbi:MAG: hypothetical protein K0Q59_4819 [Paenibacillus sp.]|nr:hypothetical protein [Paenibacillus sp.]